jgi:uncharacterized protein YndB with AHSA1/START domain
MSHAITPHDPELDLVLERVIDVPPALVWKVWTKKEHLFHWFVPKPWALADCEIDLRPGGAFNSVMRSPEGETFPNKGCFLEILENRRLVFTDTLEAGYRPSANPFMTAIVTMEPEGAGTRYVARAIHGSAETRKKHEEMGFHEGWGSALDQLVAYSKTL